MLYCRCMHVGSNSAGLLAHFSLAHGRRERLGLAPALLALRLLRHLRHVRFQVLSCCIGPRGRGVRHPGRYDFPSPWPHMGCFPWCLISSVPRTTIVSSESSSLYRHRVGSSSVVHLPSPPGAVPPVGFLLSRGRLPCVLFSIIFFCPPPSPYRPPLCQHISHLNNLYWSRCLLLGMPHRLFAKVLCREEARPIFLVSASSGTFPSPLLGVSASFEFNAQHPRCTFGLRSLVKCLPRSYSS